MIAAEAMPRHMSKCEHGWRRGSTVQSFATRVIVVWNCHISFVTAGTCLRMLASHHKREPPVHLLGECLQLEAICTKLADQEPHNKEEWRAKARVWHQRAGQFVIDMFGDVATPSKAQDNHPAQHAS